jgi:hypothetical protein
VIDTFVCDEWEAIPSYGPELAPVMSLAALAKQVEDDLADDEG